jgi:hypothetical protein
MVFVTFLLPFISRVCVLVLIFSRVAFSFRYREARDYIVLVLLLRYGTAESIYGIISYFKRSAAILPQATVTIPAVYMGSAILISVTCLTDIE